MLLQEEGTSLAVRTINHILKRQGLIGKKDSHPPALSRFERALPNQLWQMDGKGEYRTQRWKVLSAVDFGRSQPLRGGIVCVAGVHAPSRFIRVWCIRSSATACRKRC